LEIHAPDKPILTFQEAAVHLLIVTLGILIALSLEGIVEYVHHRTILKEARSIMREEIDANQKDLDQTIERMSLQKSDLVKGINIFSAMARGEKPDLGKLPYMLTLRAAEPHSAAHATAELTGAFAYMDYREVSRYAAIYDKQQRFLEAQSAAFREATEAFAWFEGRDLKAASATDLVVLTERLRQTLAAEAVASQSATSLQRDYRQFLASN